VRDWLADGRRARDALVIPAGDLHAFDDRSPIWPLVARSRRGGDAIAHTASSIARTRRAGNTAALGRRLAGRLGAEFPGSARTRERRGPRRPRHLAGRRHRGARLVAPASPYHDALRAALDDDSTVAS